MDLGILKNIGLTDGEIKVYNTLLEKGELSAGQIIKLSGLKRGDCYNKIYLLIRKDLIEEFTKNKKKAFRINDPNKIDDYTNKKYLEVSDTKKMLMSVMPEISSLYNLTYNKPNISFFEGIEGVKRVLSDTLINNIDKEILTFSDVAGYAKYLKDWNTRVYAPKRKSLGINEKVIIPNNPEAVKYMSGYKAQNVTDILFIDHNLFPFSTEINIYNGKVSFVTFSAKSHIGVIIENKQIYETFVSIFSFTWEISQKNTKIDNE